MIAFTEEQNVEIANIHAGYGGMYWVLFLHLLLSCVCIKYWKPISHQRDWVNGFMIPFQVLSILQLLELTIFRPYNGGYAAPYERLLVDGYGAGGFCGILLAMTIYLFTYTDDENAIICVEIMASGMEW